MARLNYYKQLLERYIEEKASFSDEQGDEAVAKTRGQKGSHKGKVAAYKDALGPTTGLGSMMKKASGNNPTKSQKDEAKKLSSTMNKGLKGTADNIELKKQLYAALPPSPQNLPIVIGGVDALAGKAPYQPHLLKSETSPVGKVSWNTDGDPIPPLTIAGEIGQGYNYNSFRDYLESLIADETGEDITQVKGDHPAAGEITQTLTQDPVTGVWHSESGEPIVNPWFSWEPENFDEILLDSKNTLGNVPGLTTRGIYRLITQAPVAFSVDDVLEFKTGLRGGIDPVLHVETQKEMYKGYKTLMELAGIVQEDKNGVRYIDENRIMTNAKEIADSFTYSKGKGLYIGHHASRSGREKMPFLYDMLDSVARNVNSDRSNGVTLGQTTGELGEVLSDVLLKGKDGSYKPLLRVSAFRGVSQQSSRVLSKSKEAIIAGLMNAQMGLDERGDTFVDTMIRFRDSINSVNNIATQLEKGEPIGGGIIYGEEPQEELTRILQMTGVDNIKDATMEMIKHSFYEAKIMSELFETAGVKVASVGGVDDVSRIGKRDDFTVELSSPEDYTKFNEFLQKEHGIKLRVDKSLPISLKSYVGSSREYKLGTTSVANGIKAFGSTRKQDDSGGLINQAQETHGSFDDYVKTSDLFEGMSDSERSSLVNSKNKAAETMITATKGIMSIMSNIEGSKGVSTQPLMTSFEDIVFDKSSGLDPDHSLEVMKNFKAAYSVKGAKNKNDRVGKEVAEAGVDMINLVRMAMGRDKKMLKGLALNDLISSAYTEEDEALMHSMQGDIRISGRHHIVSFLMTECEPKMNNKGGISWKYKSGKTVFRSNVREKEGTMITEGSANSSLFNSVAKVFYRDVDKNLNEESSKEGAFRKLEEILAKINEVLAV